jgi:Chitobiase/beta-hexosaminidase C-terminal domain
MARVQRSLPLARAARHALVVLGMAIAAGPAAAAVTAPHIVATLANSSGLELSDYTPGENLTVDVVRGGNVVGTLTGPVALDGTFNVNPTECWVGVTPVILADDVIRVTSDQATFVDESPVKNITIDTIEEVAGVLKVHGTAQDTAGNPLPVSEIESRIISTSGEFFHENGRKRIQTGHVGAPGEGSMAYDAPGSSSWTATYAGLDAHDLALAQAASTELRGLWASLAADEVTIMILGATPGPAAPCTAPLKQNAVVKATPKVVSLATNGTDLALEGVSFDATSVQVKVDDADVNTPAVTVTATTPGPALGSQTWTATIGAADVAGLSDGPLKVSGTYFSAADPGGIPGQDLTVQKDLVAPEAPTISPGPGTYSETQAVLLQHAEAGFGTKIVYTTDGSDPTPSSARANGQIFVSNSLSLKAMVIDAVGNTSPVASFAFSIARPPVTGGGSIGTGGTGGSGAGATVGSGMNGGSSKTSAKPVVSALRAKCIPVGAVRGKSRVKCRSGISFSLTSPAQVVVVVRNAKGRVLGSFVRSGAKGVNAWILPAKIGGRALKPGKYTVSITASAGGLTSGKASTSVTVPKP